jgi:hypothetical protein
LRNMFIGIIWCLLFITGILRKAFLFSFLLLHLFKWMASQFGTLTNIIKFFVFWFLVESYRSLEKNTQGQPYSVVSLAKWRILNRLHDRNETLYYRVSSVAILILKILKSIWNLMCFTFYVFSSPGSHW